MLAVSNMPPKLTHRSLNTAITPTAPPTISARPGFLMRGCPLGETDRQVAGAGQRKHLSAHCSATSSPARVQEVLHRLQEQHEASHLSTRGFADRAFLSKNI
jgi:hypothetical protein